MVERPILTLSMSLSFNISDPFPESDIALTARPVVRKLNPPGGDVGAKFQLNGLSMTGDDVDGEAGLFIRMARVNHHCIEKPTHWYLKNRNARILVASRPIEPGEEITFSYSSLYERKENNRRFRLYYGFECRCHVCTNPDLHAEMAQLKELDDGMYEMWKMGMVEFATRRGKALIQLY